MSNTYYSPEGNPEIWDSCPEGYFTEAAWQQKQEIAAREKAEEELAIKLLPENLYAAKNTEIDDKYTAAMVRLNAAYTKDEASTFYQQLTEANLYTADNTTYNAFLENAAKQRGITVEELVTKILERADVYAAKAGYLTGKKAAFKATLRAIGNADSAALQDFAVDYTIVDEEVV